MKVRRRKSVIGRQLRFLAWLDWWIGDGGNGATTDLNVHRHWLQPGKPRIKPSPKRWRAPWMKKTSSPA